MEVKSGYKQTEVGVIPEDWDVVQIVEVADMITVGFVGSMSHLFTEHGIPLLRGQNVLPNKLDLTETRNINEDTHKRWRKSSLLSGDVVMVRVGYPGTSCVIPKGFGDANAASLVIVRPSRNKIRSQFLSLVINSNFGKRQIESYLVGGAQQVLNTTTAAVFKLPLPKIKEQDAIAEALTDADALIELLEQVIAKKRQIKQGAMQELLTCKRRLPGFSGEWKEKKISDIASPSSEKNTSGEELPVLTCSKHLGFVDSLRYFKNQVFSDNTSTYKIIRNGQIGYPANHVEEGSIGLQDLYPTALVSPIYVVFSTNEGISSYFIHRLLKLDSYRQKFKTATTSSVDRRGSLRWPTFSEITVLIPPTTEEQNAISHILSDMEKEIVTIEESLLKARQIRQGMMQELLTGRIRLV